MTGYQVGPTLAPGEDPWPLGWESDPAVKACPHNAWESVLTQPRYSRFEECIRCVACHAPRCGHSNDPDPCMLVRHHRTHHVRFSGELEPVGGYKCANGTGCGCGARRAS